MKKYLTALFLTLAACSAQPAFADPLSAIKSFSLNDVKAAEAAYAANPSVPTYKAAVQCLGWVDATLSAPGAPLNLNLVVPVGAVSAIADLDIALSTANQGLPPVVLDFNQNCGGYIEDLKAEAAVHAGGIGLNVFGLHL